MGFGFGCDIFKIGNPPSMHSFLMNHYSVMLINTHQLVRTSCKEQQGTLLRESKPFASFPSEIVRGVNRE